MNPLVVFLTMLAVSVGVALLWRFPPLWALVEAIAFAGGMTLVFFGEQIPLAYTPKAMLIVLAVVVSTWAYDRMVRSRRTPSVRPISDL